MRLASGESLLLPTALTTFFPAEVAKNLDDGQPWHNAPDELSCGELWRALDENM